MLVLVVGGIVVLVEGVESVAVVPVKHRTKKSIIEFTKKMIAYCL